MAQFLRPNADVTTTGVVAGTWASIDETTADDNTSWIATDDNVAATYECALTNPSTPISGTCTARVRVALADGGAPTGVVGTSLTINAYVYQGTTLIATIGSTTDPSTWTTLSTTFAASAVTDWTDVRIRFTCNNAGGAPANRRGMSITWAEIETPDAAVAYTLACDSGSFAVTGTAASLERGYVLAADSGAYIVTGTDAGLTVPIEGPISLVGSSRAGSNGQTVTTTSIDLTALTGGVASAPIEGDLVVAAISIGSANVQTTPPIVSSGYTDAFTALYQAGTTYGTNLRVAYKFMGATPDTTFEFGPSGSGTDALACVLFVFRGVDPTTPLDVTPTTASAAGFNATNPPSITPTTVGAMILGVGASGSPTCTAYSSSDLTDLISQNGSDTNDTEVAIGLSANWQSGAVDPATWTGGATNSAASWAAASVALRPAGNAYTLACDSGSFAVTGTAVNLWRKWDSTGKWTPADLSNTIPAHFDAYAPESLTLVSGAVSSWASKVGSITADQSTAGSRPAFSETARNSRPGLDFDGTDDHLILSALTDFISGTGEGRIIAVGYLDTDNALYRQIFSYGDMVTAAWPPSGTFGQARQLGANPSEQPSADIFGTGVSDTTRTWLNTDRIAIARFSGQNYYIKVDGNTELSGSTGQTVSTDPLYGYIGAYANSTPTGDWWTGVIQEIIVVNGSLTTDEVERIEGYLAHKWGLAGSLPSGHTYKSAAPTSGEYSLACASGSFSVTGTAASLERGYVLTADSGSFAITGTAAGLLYGRHLAADAGAFTVTGTAASLERGYVLAAASGTYVVTGTAMSPERGYAVQADSGSYAVTGTAAGLAKGRTLSVDAGSYAVTGTAAALEHGHAVAANSGTFTVTGTAAELVKASDYTLVAESGAFTVTGPMWTPAELGAAVVGWWDAAKTDTFTLDGSNNVDSWASRVGSITADYVSGSRGVYSATARNGLPGITTVGTGRLVLSALTGFPTGSDEGRIAVVGYCTASTYSAAMQYGSGFDGTDRFIQRAGASLVGFYTNGQATLDVRGSGVGAGAAWNSRDIVFIGRAGPGNIIGAKADGDTEVTKVVTVNTGSTAGYIGAASSFSFQGVLQEILVISGATSSTDIEKLEGYLAHKWGLVANLPGGHAYKSALPSGGDVDLTVTRSLAAASGSFAVTGTAASLDYGSSTSYTLACDSGSFTVTGTAAGLLYGRRLAADAGSFTVTGTAVGLLADRTLTADAGSFTVIGTAAGLLYGRRLAADAGSFTVTGTAAGLLADRTLTADAGSFTVTGTAAGLVKTGSYTLAADSGLFTVTGTAAGLLADRTLVADAGSFTVTGTAASLERGYVLAADAGSFAVTGTAAGLLADRTLAADAGSFTVTGTAAALIKTGAFALVCETGSFAVTGTAAGLSAARILRAQGGLGSLLFEDGTEQQFENGDPITVENGGFAHYELSGTAAALEQGHAVAADSGSVTITGTAASLERGYVLACSSGSFTVTGTAAGLLADRTLAADAGSFTVTGTAAALIKTGAFALVCETGSFAVTGTAASLEQDRILAADSGSVSVTGTVVGLSVDHPLTAGSGAVVVTGTDAGLKQGYRISADPGSINVTGSAINLLRGGTLAADGGTVVVTGTAVAFSRGRVLAADSGSYQVVGTDIDIVTNATGRVLNQPASLLIGI